MIPRSLFQAAVDAIVADVGKPLGSGETQKRFTAIQRSIKSSIRKTKNKSERLRLRRILREMVRIQTSLEAPSRPLENDG